MRREGKKRDETAKNSEQSGWWTEEGARTLGDFFASPPTAEPGPGFKTCCREYIYTLYIGL